MVKNDPKCFAFFAPMYLKGFIGLKMYILASDFQVKDNKFIYKASNSCYVQGIFSL